LLALLCAAPVFAADDNSSGNGAAVVHAGGLSCFSITPPVDPKHWPEHSSCDALCAAKGAACTGMQNAAMNPPTKCSDPPPPKFAVCRCCAVAR
jgi:hypothetical protein